MIHLHFPNNFSSFILIIRWTNNLMFLSEIEFDFFGLIVVFRASIVVVYS